MTTVDHAFEVDVDEAVVPRQQASSNGAVTATPALLKSTSRRPPAVVQRPQATEPALGISHIQPPGDRPARPKLLPQLLTQRLHGGLIDVEQTDHPPHAQSARPRLAQCQRRLR